MEERRDDSSERTKSDAVEGFSKGDNEEAAASPVWRIPSRIGPAEAEGAKALRQNRRMKQKAQQASTPIKSRQCCPLLMNSFM